VLGPFFFVCGPPPWAQMIRFLFTQVQTPPVFALFFYFNDFFRRGYPAFPVFLREVVCPSKFEFGIGPAPDCDCLHPLCPAQGFRNCPPFFSPPLFANAQSRFVVLPPPLQFSLGTCLGCSEINFNFLCFFLPSLGGSCGVLCQFNSNLISNSYFRPLLVTSL